MSSTAERSFESNHFCSTRGYISTTAIRVMFFPPTVLSHTVTFTSGGSLVPIGFNFCLKALRSCSNSETSSEIRSKCVEVQTFHITDHFCQEGKECNQNPHYFHHLAVPQHQRRTSSLLLNPLTWKLLAATFNSALCPLATLQFTVFLSRISQSVD